MAGRAPSSDAPRARTSRRRRAHRRSPPAAAPRRAAPATRWRRPRSRGRSPRPRRAGRRSPGARTRAPQQDRARDRVGRRFGQLLAREDGQRRVAGAGRLPFQHRERLFGRVRLDDPAQQRQRLGERLVRTRGRALARRRRRPQQYGAGRGVAAGCRQLLQRLRASRSRPSFVASVTPASSTAPSPGATSRAARPPARPPRDRRDARRDSSDRPTSGTALSFDQPGELRRRLPPRAPPAR